MQKANVDLVRVDPMDIADLYAYNTTNSLAAYTTPGTATHVAGCEAMYDTSSAEYTMYMDGVTAVSNAYADEFMIAYTNHKSAGISEAAANLAARNDTQAYINANIGTIAPSYDASFLNSKIYSCYYEQFYDRMFYDNGETPTDASIKANTMATYRTNLCTDMTQVANSLFVPCLQL